MAFPTVGSPLASMGINAQISAAHRYNDNGNTAPSTGIVVGYNFPILGVPISPGTYSPAVKGDVLVDAADSNKFKYYNGSSWVDLTSGGSGGGISLRLEDQGSNRGTVSSGTGIIDFQGQGFQVSTVSGNQWQVYIEKFLEAEIKNSATFAQSTIGTTWNTISGSSRTISKRSPLSVMVTFANYRASIDWDNVGSRVNCRIRFNGVNIDSGTPDFDQQDTSDNLVSELCGWAWLSGSSAAWDFQADSQNASDDIEDGVYQIVTF